MRTRFTWDKQRVKKPQDKQQLLQQVYEHTVGNRSKGITPKNRQEISKLINRSEQWVWELWQVLVREGKLQKDPNTGHLLRSEQDRKQVQYAEMAKSAFIQIPSVQKWFNDLMTAGKNGKPAASVNSMVQGLNVVCNTLNIHPDALLQDIDTSVALLKEFERKFKAGEARYAHQLNNNNNINFSIKEVTNYVAATRNFMIRNGIAIPRGITGIMSGKKKRFGAYANVKLTDREFERGLKFMHGYGFEELFAVLHEVFPRTKTGITMVNKFEIRPIDAKGVRGEYAIMQLYESKTDRAFDKMAIHPKVIEIIKRVKHGATFCTNDVGSNARVIALESELASALSDYYVSLGKIDRAHYDEHNGMHQKWNYPKGTDEWYWANKPVYVLRHSGAHAAMRRTASNATLVASMGWDDVNTLLKVYARTTAEAILMQDVCYYHNPPEIKDENYDYFCSMRCAIGYYHNGSAPHLRE